MNFVGQKIRCFKMQLPLLRFFALSASLREKLLVLLTFRQEQASY